VLILFRILQLEHFLEAFTLLDDAYDQCKATLAATGLLGGMVWVGCATLFYIFEKDNQDLLDAAGLPAFRNIPNSMYFTAIFLGGEWAQTDFSIPGQLVCLFLVVAGIGLYAVPLGAIFDAFQDLLTGDDDDDDDGEEAGGGDDGEEEEQAHEAGGGSPMSSDSRASKSISEGQSSVMSPGSPVSQTWYSPLQQQPLGEAGISPIAPPSDLSVAANTSSVSLSTPVAAIHNHVYGERANDGVGAIPALAAHPAIARLQGGQEAAAAGVSTPQSSAGGTPTAGTWDTPEY
jgi:hypothetical protein